MSEKTYRLVWEAEDGYCGGSRPQHLKLRLSDFDGCETIDSVRDLIGEMVQADFEDTVRPAYTDEQLASEIFRDLQKQAND